MKEDVMKLWVKALRSGDYKQGRGQLKRSEKNGNTRFCCLGVLCDISLLTTWGQAVDSYFGSTGHLTPKVREWSGITSRSGAIFNTEFALTTYNDEGKTFDEIADIIEKHWEEL